MVDPKTKNKTTTRAGKQQKDGESASASEIQPDSGSELQDDQTDFSAKHIKTFESLLEKHLEPIHNSINDAIIKIQAEIESVKLRAENGFKIAERALKLAEENKSAIDKLSEENKKLKTENTSLKNKMHDASEQNEILDERIENRTNRQLRKTLIFKGIPEASMTNNDEPHDDQNNKAETWNDTERVLASQIANIGDIPFEEAKRIIERCHRSNPNPKYKGTGPRPIFAAFHDWKDSEWLKTIFRKNNMNNPGCHIYCEQKFGSKTTQRRNQAMVMRKKLKDDGKIFNGYVAYPARLMVKTSDARGAKYILEKDFSKDEVNFGR